MRRVTVRRMTDEGETAIYRNAESIAIGGPSPSSPSSVRTGGSFPRWGKHRVESEICLTVPQRWHIMNMQKGVAEKRLRPVSGLS